MSGMRREFAIAAGVLVPFAVLVAAGFWFSAGNHGNRGHDGEQRAQHDLAPSSFTLRALDASVVTPVAPHPGPLPASQGEGVNWAPLRAVSGQVRQCFRDQRIKQPHSVRVRFTPTPSGAFEEVLVDEQNPYLAACIEDVFAEIHWAPEGGEKTFLPMSHTFSFDPSAD